MLGIIFTGGEGPAAQIVKRLIADEPTAKDAIFAAADSGLTAAENAGVKPHWIVGDMDSLESEKSLCSYPAEKIIRHITEKDYTDTELAFSLLREKGCDNIWIFGGGGGRLDHLFAIRSLFEREIFPRRWITDSEDIRCIDAEKNGHGSMNSVFARLEKGAIVSVFPLGDRPWDAASVGLKWPLAGLSWNRGFFGLSNVAVDGEFSITAEKGRFMVILPIDNKEEKSCRQ